MASQTIPSGGINRREFLYYLGGASVALFAAGSCAGITLLATPRFREGVDFFEIVPSFIIAVDQPPIMYPEMQAWIGQTDQGLLVLYAFCTLVRDQGGKPKWVETNNRFECPSCGSKYQKDGTYIEGPAPRGMDRFVIEVTTPNGKIRTPDDGSPVKIEGATRIVVYPQQKILGQARKAGVLARRTLR